MKLPARRVLAAVLVLAMPLPAVAQAVAGPSASPLPGVSVVLAPDSLRDLPRRTVTVTDEHGTSATYAGADVEAVLARAGATAGSAMRGPALAQYVVVRGADGYRAVFALAELDPGFTDRVVLLADRRDGQPLPARLGPYQVVVPGEKRNARWVRNVVEIDIRSAP